MSVPVITVAQMREWEKATWASGQTEEEVIRQAGAAVARFAERVTRPEDSILVLVGKGHNGDDALQAALQIHSREVKVLRVSDPEMIAEDLESNLGSRPALVVDGLFGIGLNRSLGTPWIDLIRKVNRSGCPILSVDTPSGLQADLGVPLEEAIRATWTLTLGAVKRGMTLATAWPFVGRLEVAHEIGLLPYPFSTECNLVAPEDFYGFPPARSVASHKGSYGHLVILAGSLGYHGAGVLAARGARRAQPGLISLLTHESAYLPAASQLQSVMVHPWSDHFRLPKTCTGLLAGPGLASPDLTEDLKHMVRNWWQEAALPMVVDASALDWIAPGWCHKQAVRLVTPHPGEAARMLKITPGEVQSDRTRSLRELSRRWGGCRVVLKGHQTMTGQEKEELYINNSGNPRLAQGGSGDLLAGYLAGLLAQPILQQQAPLAIRFGVWQHGASADELDATRPNWTVEDLEQTLGQVRPAKPA
jgi:ADP-dependent NAD(P)H-hydrate dehydratase / NAD(P)H-hydrate epimerase